MSSSDKPNSVREAILAAARRVMLRNGEPALMEDVATEAGVARRTVFNHFGTKEGLFEEILLRFTQENLPRLDLISSGDIRTDLLDFSLRYAAAITSEVNVSNYRMLSTLGPESSARLAKAQQADYVILRNSLVVYLTDQIAAGRLKPFQAKYAAERLLASVVGMDRVQVSLGIVPDRTDREAYITDTIDEFLRGILTT